MPAISLSGVSKRFGATTVVDQIDLQVHDGELLVLVGGSGSGKSTILRMLAGLESVSTGTIHIGERDVTSLSPRDRDVAMVFQDYALYPHMSVRENLSLGLRLRRVSAHEIERRVAWAGDMLGLAPLLGRKPAELSGGQRQRVAMGRAMVREPLVFLFDEPLSNLDSGLRAQMRMEIGALQRRLATTTVYVTHDQVEAMTLGDRIVVLANGRIQQVGRPIDLYHEPANRFVAGFIGSPTINFVEGQLEVGDGAPHFLAEGLRVPLLRPSVMGLASQPATLGIRPEDITVNQVDHSETADGQLGREATPAVVVLVERLGGTSHVHAAIGATPQRVVAVVAGDHLPAIGDRVSLTLREDRVHLFGADGIALR